MRDGDSRRRDGSGRDYAAYVRDQVRGAMVSKGLSERELARRSGIAPTTLRGRLASAKLTTGDVDALAEGLEMSIDELLNSAGFIVVVGDVGDGSNVVIGSDIELNLAADNPVGGP